MIAQFVAIGRKETRTTPLEDALYARHGRLHYFIREILKRGRVPATHASKVADTMVAAELGGKSSEGICRLPEISQKLSTKLIDPLAEVETVLHDQAIAVLDANNGLGPIAAGSAMELSIQNAKQKGLGAVAVRHGNDFGVAGYYARMAIPEQMIGIVLANAPPTMLPPNGHEPMVGANPIAIAIPTTENAPPFILDMATTHLSRHRLMQFAEVERELPPGMAIDQGGEQTRDVEVAAAIEKWTALGAPGSAHKGFGLALAIDILCGVLSGGGFGRELASQATHQTPAGIGQFFLSLRVRSFTPWIKFRNRMQEFVNGFVKAGDLSDRSIYYPGEMGYAIEQDRRSHGIPISKPVGDELASLARSLDIQDAWEHVLEGRKNQ